MLICPYWWPVSVNSTMLICPYWWPVSVNSTMLICPYWWPVSVNSTMLICPYWWPVSVNSTMLICPYWWPVSVNSTMLIIPILVAWNRAYIHYLENTLHQQSITKYQTGSLAPYGTTTKSLCNNLGQRTQGCIYI